MLNHEGRIFQVKKYQQLVDYLKRKEFPILIHGHSGTGKTFTLLKALKACNLNYRVVELDGRILRKPIDKSLITLVYLYDQKDLEIIKFKENLIIETTIPWANKFEGFKALKFTRLISKNSEYSNRLLDEFLHNTENVEVDLFKFLGRIFYKKLSVTDIYLENKTIVYKIPNHKFENLSLLQDLRYSDSVSEKENEKLLRRKFLLDESENDSYLTKTESVSKNEEENSISIDEESLFNSLESQISECKDGYSIDLAVSCLKKIFKKDENLEKVKYSKSYALNIFEKFIFENFVYFINNTFDLQAVYDCLSMANLNVGCFLCLIQSLLQVESKKIKSFSSFKYSKKENCANKNRNWRYNYHLQDENT